MRPAALILLVLPFAACSGNPGPQPPQPPPVEIPDPQCQPGQTHSCWHWPPDSTMPLYACPVYDANGGVVGVINVAGGPAQCPKPPEPPTEPPTEPPAGATDCDGEPGGLTGETTSAYGQVVNEVMRDLTGCPIGSDCRLGDTTRQQFQRAVIAELRVRGVCAGQHEPLVTDEIAVSQDRASVREGYHIFAGNDAETPAPPGDTSRRVVWSPGAARPSYYGNAEQPPTEPPVEPPPSGACPFVPCPIHEWSAETLPPGWDSALIGTPAGLMNCTDHRANGGKDKDCTPLANRQEPFCAAIGMSPYADGQPRNDCPMRPDGHPEREPMEVWFLYGGWKREGRNGQDCTPASGGQAAILNGTGNCRMCNARGTMCSPWF